MTKALTKRSNSRRVKEAGGDISAAGQQGYPISEGHLEQSAEREVGACGIGFRRKVFEGWEEMSGVSQDELGVFSTRQFVEWEHLCWDPGDARSTAQ